MMRRVLISTPTVERLESRTLLAAALATDLATFRAVTGRLLMDTNSDLVADRKPFIGQSGDQAAAGDLDGNTVTDLAIYRNGLWSLDYNADGGIDRQLHFGDAAQTPLLGDMNGDGFADLVIYNRETGVWAVDLTRDGVADTRTIPYFRFGGQPGDVALVGDVNGDGRDEPVIYRGGTWLVDYNRDGSPEVTFTVAGAPAGTPVLMKWNGDYRSRPAIFRDGTWFLATTDDRVITETFNYGFGGEQPLSGNFRTTDSIFVRAGATGDGSLHRPMGSLQRAIDVHQPGQVIRLAVGDYSENVVAYRKDQLTIVGANQNTTRLLPASGDAIVVILGNDTWMHNLRAAGGGRGVVALGADLHLRYINTVGVRDDGLVANDNDTERRASRLDIAFSTFNEAQRGHGIWLHGNTVASIRRTTMSGNGTAGGLIPTAANGRGIVIAENSSAIIRRSWINNNFDTGLFAIQNASATILLSAMSFNRHGNGAMFDGNAKVEISGSTFQQNGLVRDPNDLSAGRNGIEFFTGFTGPAKVSNSVFRNNTGFGIFVAAGTGIVITSSMFDNNWCGVGIEGDRATQSSVTVQSSTFQVPAGSWYEAGVFIYGPNATLLLGGAAPALKNTFRNYAPIRSVMISPKAANGEWVGYPTVPLAESDNIFIDSPQPIWWG